MTISIITVVYNDQKGLEKTINSVKNINYSDYEFIVVDGNSSDGTIELIKSKEKIISKWISEPDKGIYDAMNKGIRMSSGEWLVFMNAGDTFYDSNVLSFVSTLFDGYDIVYGSMLRYSSKVEYITKGVTSPRPTAFDFLHGSFGHQASYINRRVFDIVGLYSTSYKLASDAKFFFDAAVIHNVRTLFIDKPFARFEIGGASTSNSVLYNNERKDFLVKALGQDIYDQLEELYQYRNSKMAQKALCIEHKIKKTIILKYIKMIFR